MSIYSSLLSSSSLPRRKVFISYFKGDKNWVDSFVKQYGPEGEGIFTPKALGVNDIDDFVNSDNPEYIMSQIREKYLGDSSVTIVLIGSCTHSRRYVDWEIKSSLRRGTILAGPIPNGLIGITIPPLSSGPNWPHLPDRFKRNFQKNGKGYARYYTYPTLGATLRSWIEDAYNARTNRVDVIDNPQDVMKYNSKCLAHGETHVIS
ncbi:MAG: hypothetical protein COW12_00565 [Candidatus Omnitrophica bacterium CG12_big_fil_rev_8_21_14_0_65_45_16]|nr:MAG: hypothetical protein COW12_00565 [Candidatus Omnitrophica bacterium CG12_big_fil_rev_8_21_14_0_65_45_16]